MTPNLDLLAAAENPPQRTAARQALADAHAAKSQAEKDLESARLAFTRGKHAVAKTAERLQTEQDALATSTAARAQQLAYAADMDTAPPPAMTGRARARELEAEDEHAATVAALAVLQARVDEAEDAHRAASMMVIACTDRILRGLAKRTLADAVDATLRLKKARLLLHFLDCPEAAGKVPHLGVQRSVFDDEIAFEGERGWRRADATKAAAAVRDEGFASETAAAIKCHLELALGSIYQGEQQWSLAPELAPWVAARDALIGGDADAPLPLPRQPA
jgi:hypothetical protein